MLRPILVWILGLDETSQAELKVWSSTLLELDKNDSLLFPSLLPVLLHLSWIADYVYPDYVYAVHNTEKGSLNNLAVLTFLFSTSLADRTNICSFLYIYILMFYSFYGMQPKNHFFVRRVAI